MAKKINLGKVGITTAGAYDPNKAYERLSCVTYNYESWVSTKDVPAGNTPQDGSEYWQKMSARGAQGIQGEKGEQGIQGVQGPQGNSGYQGAAGELEVVNNLTRGGESSALSAEQGKVLKQEITELSAEVDGLFFEIGNIYVGSEIDNPDMLRSAYVPCKVGDSISGYIYRVIKYDSNQTYIADEGVGNSGYDNVTITISDANCAFIRVVLRKDVAEKNVSFNGGSLFFKAEKNLTKKVAEVDKLNRIVGEYIENPEFSRVYVDGEGKILLAILSDGSVEFAKGIPTPIKKELSALALQVNSLSDILSTFEDVENRTEITFDQEGKILAYRTEDGCKCETRMSVVESFELQKNAMAKFQQSLKDSGFNVESPIDWSNEPTIKLPIPRYCAKVNIISPTGLGITKTDNKKCILEYWDKSGNYFKKYIILNAQGSSSMAYIEKNQGIDVFNDEACEESCDIIFGNWVAQDSFHLKCYYIDVFRGVANIGYNFCEEVIQHLDSRNNRILFDTSNITAFDSTGDFDVDFGDGALCHPDGFPFEMYVNGEYYGLFAWNLKKHRKNYSMNKKDYSAILLDGEIGANELFGGNIDWTAFELRNPKDLITMDGGKYDGENPQELIDSTSAKYDASNSTHVKTAQTKALIIRQSKAVGLIAAEKNTDNAKALFEQYYDVKPMSAYFIVGNVLHHYDGFWKNWIWTLYGNIFAPSFYDMDSIFGRSFDGLYVVENSTTRILGIADTLPTGQLVRLYKSELEEAYKSLRDAKIISVNNIMMYVNSWMQRVGLDAYKMNIEKWTSIPSYRSAKNMDDGTQEGGFFDSKKRIQLWLEQRINILDGYFNYR